MIIFFGIVEHFYTSFMILMQLFKMLSMILNGFVK